MASLVAARIRDSRLCPSGLALSDGGADAGLKIVLPEGLQLRVTARTDLDLVARVLTLLRR
ncbi:hypothetical protein [Komagataeibacter europaeus]|uniref:hypothetical protein n=1 Tax=Komagataeibacter europaeus TaxID=33995 RepID=UPI000237EDB6|nr:hypothetical protein [Komagataeibacter europaeus]